MAYLGNIPARSFISFERQVFTIVNSQTAYTLDHSVTNENDIRLVVNNVIQEPGSGKAYTASGTTLTLSAALTNGTDEMYCVFLGRAVGTVDPPAGSVSTSQLASDAVTEAKIADGAVESEHLNNNVISGQTELAAEPADTDEFLVSDAGTIKRIDYSHIKGGVDGWSSSSGSLLPASASAGIYLGVNSATASNLLSDYEEGTWTVDFIRSGSSIGSFSSRSAYYTKIGNVVYVNGGTQYTGSSLTGAYITGSGLPFTISNQNRTGVAGSYHVGPGSGSTNQQAGNAGGWNEQDDFFMVPGGVGQDRYLDEWQQNYYLNFAFWYYTDA